MKWMTPGVGHVGVGAAERLGGDLLAGHLLDDLGPVMNIWAWRVWMMKSVSAGE